MRCELSFCPFAEAVVLDRLRRLFGSTRPVRAAGHPRELLKAATNTRLAVVALLVASVCIVLTVRYDTASEQATSQRERQLVGLFFDQLRLNLTSQMAGIANGFQVPSGRSVRETLQSVHVSIVENTLIAPGSLEVFLLQDEELIDAISLGSSDPRQSFEIIREPVRQLTGLFGKGALFSHSDMALVGGRLAVISHAVSSQAPMRAASRAPAGAPPSLVTVYWLDDAAQAELRKQLLFPSMRIEPGSAALAATTSAVTITNGDGVALAQLSWQLAHDRTNVRVQGLMLAAVLALSAVWIGIASRRKRREVHELVGEVEAQVYDVAMRDPLTGLLNRASFKRKLEGLVAARTGNELIGVVYVDLDRFKQVNDGYGHLKGDELLCAVTERLRDLSDAGLTVARLGGDEFALIVEYRTSPEAIMALAEQACEGLGRPFQLGEVEALIGGSVGVSICPLDGEEHQELLRRADIAMYRAKTAGRSNTVRFDISMDNDVQELRALEADLRNAIERNEMSLAYQPFWASDGQTIVGVEALLRWNHPKRGQVSPTFFVPIAEEAGLIHELGEWAIATAMRQARAWGGIILAVNISPIQFKRPALAERIKELLDKTGFEPERLEIEITEGVLMDDAEAAVKFMRGFKEIGVHIALDDFGTGFSSLSYLRRFPFDKLKVDQSFVRALGSGHGTAAIIHSVIALGRALGMTVHAEGVETLEHHIFLRAAGCHHLQGFLFSRPLAAADMELLLASRTVRPAPKSMLARAAAAAHVPSPRTEAPTFEQAGPDLGVQLRARVAEMKQALGGAGTVNAGTVNAGAGSAATSDLHDRTAPEARPVRATGEDVDVDTLPRLARR
jgi:diguanylate cyclase (GGDEF)-like protein